MLFGLAGVAAGCGRARQGARLLGAAEGLLRATYRALSGADRVVHDHALAMLRRELSEAEFQEARQSGETLSMEEAIEYALEREPS